MFRQLKYALAHPLTRDLDIDHPETTRLRRTIIEQKPFLKKVYREWFSLIAEQIGKGSGQVVELGSGAGFLKEFIPDLITSEVFPSPGVEMVFDGGLMPFRDESLRGITMTNVMHHIPALPAFFQEATRCLRPGGKIVAIEPWVSDWSKLVYTNFHHEPFDTLAKEWSFAADGPLSSANGALPWIVCERDRSRFEAQFPQLKIRLTKGLMPFRYLVCGGISMRSFVPSFTFPLWRAFEQSLNPRRWAIFALIVIEKC